MISVAFRVDASLQIGSGHVMRCLALAEHLRDSGVECTFICRPHAGHLINFISSHGYPVLVLPAVKLQIFKNNPATSYEVWLGVSWETDAADTKRLMANKVFDWIVVDHYALGVRWEQILRSNARRVMSIDDLADRPRDCDLLLDQNLGRTIRDYSNLVNSSTAILLGPQYALLRSEFAKLRPNCLTQRASPRFLNLLIAMGGVDKDNATGKVLDALKTSLLPRDLFVTVVMGANAPWLAQIKVQAEQMPRSTQVLVDVSNMAQLIAESDLAIGAAGGSAWERCCLGLPSLTIALADNQQAGAVALEKAGASILIDDYHQIPQVLYELQFSGFKNKTLFSLAKASFAVTDGSGCERVAQQMLVEYE